MNALDPMAHMYGDVVVLATADDTWRYLAIRGYTTT